MKSEQKTRLIHLHVPKTAGTALRTAFEKASKGEFRAFPHWDESKYVNFSPDDYDFFSGHISYKIANKIGGDIVTVLRSPVDRFLSVYYFWRQLGERGKENSRKTQLARKYSLAEFVKIRDEPLLIESLQNRVTWQIAHGNSIEDRRELRERGAGDNEILNLALNNLSAFAVVGLQEQMADFAARINDQFGVRLNVKKTNVTESRATVSEIDMSVLRAIHEWVYMDLELYQQAIKMLGDR